MMEHLADLVWNPLSVLLVLLVVIVIVYYVGIYNYRVFNSMNIPGAKPLPYLGNLRDMAKYGGINLCMLEYMKKYGKIFSLCIGRKPFIVIADPEILKQIMIKDFDVFTNRGIENPINIKGLFSLKGSDWRRIRTILTPTFTSGKLKLMIPSIEKSCLTLVDKVQEIADTGKSVDIMFWFSMMTLEVIMATAFGVESPVQTESTNNVFLIKSREAFKSQLWLRMLRIIPFSDFFIRMSTKLSGRNEFFADVAKKILKTRKGHEVQRDKDLVDILLNAKNADGTPKLSDDEITAQSLVFLLAGHETTSNTITMSAYFLALNPDVQERLRMEIVIAQQTYPDKPLYELVNELEYLECVINEVLRISPPAYMTFRSGSKKYKVNDATTIPAGMNVFIPIFCLHHDPDAWPEPDKFDPERFRGPAKESRHPFQFLPFGEGPRNCIGKRLALLEVKITLVNILTKYKFVRCPETQVPLNMLARVTLIPKDGVFVRVESCK